MDNEKLVEYGTAKKDWWEFTEEDIKDAQDKIYARVRERAWAVGSPVYYKIGDLMIAEYPGGKKMVVEKDGTLETEKPYHG